VTRRLDVSVFAALVAIIVMGAGPRTAAAATSFTVTNSGMSAFVVNGANNPALTLVRGQTYTFSVTVFGHPFWITTARGAGDAEANAFAQEVTGNGASGSTDSPGVVTFTVPASAPATLFYQCSFHDPMGGTLNIVSPIVSVPATTPAALAALAALLLLGGAAALRRRTARRA
jgi:hypothetical protein